MELKFYLNKFLKADNIEGYTLKSLGILRKTYESFLESSEGTDPDFPMVDFGSKGKKVQGVNKSKLSTSEDIEDIFNSL